MNLNFEKETLDFLASKELNIVYEENLSALQSMRLAIDASILL